jgi:hypothetical protein
MATSCAQEIHVGDIGTVFEVTLQDCDVPLDVSTATEQIIYLLKPDGTLLEKDSVFTTDGTDGKIQYVAIAGDLDQEGSWKIQAKVTLPSGSWSSDIDKFKVTGNLATA